MEKTNSTSQKNNREDQYSISPLGEKFKLPRKEEFQYEFDRLKELSDKSRQEGKEIVVVMGVGFVGAVMAAIVADTTDESGRSSKFVIGCQRPSIRSYWKIPLLNDGTSPVKAEDPEVDKMIARCVNEKKSLTATFNSDCLQLADCVVVDKSGLKGSWVYNFLDDLQTVDFGYIDFPFHKDKTTISELDGMTIYISCPSFFPDISSLTIYLNGKKFFMASGEDLWSVKRNAVTKAAGKTFTLNFNKHKKHICYK